MLRSPKLIIEYYYVLGVSDAVVIDPTNNYLFLYTVDQIPVSNCGVFIQMIMHLHQAFSHTICSFNGSGLFEND